jgi:hypothetical protein
MYMRSCGAAPSSTRPPMTFRFGHTRADARRKSEIDNCTHRLDSSLQLAHVRTRLTSDAGWQPHVKCCAVPGNTNRPQAPTVRLND